MNRYVWFKLGDEWLLLDTKNSYKIVERAIAPHTQHLVISNDPSIRKR
jgi:hypothetical protein